MIDIKNLTKIYHTDKEGSLALKNITIKFPEVGFVALTGQSGSGKTTLLNILGGFLPFEEGEMYIFDKDVLTFQKEDWQHYQKKDIGFIFQDYGLVEDYSVLDNILLSLTIIGLDKSDALERAYKYLGIVHLDDMAHQKVKHLSSGQKQRLSIARALAKEPKIILCDEPTANLDPENSVEIMKLLADASKDKLVVVSTHNYEDAKDYANYFVRIYNGELVSYDTLKEAPKREVKETTYKKSHTISLYKLFLKNRFGWLISNNIFTTIVMTLLLVLLSIFVYNLDTASAIDTDNSIFNNLNSNELLIMRHDYEPIDAEAIKEVLNINHVTAYDKYGISTDMNYYYREDIDYRYDVSIMIYDTPAGPVEDRIYEFNKFNKSLYMKTHIGHILESDLADGKLPEGMFEVVADKNYQVGDKITVYIDNYALLGTNELQFEFTVTGILKEACDDLYFSEAFMQQMDFVGKISYENSFYLYMRYFGRYNQRKSVTVNFIPIYLGYDLDGDNIVLSHEAAGLFGLAEMPSAIDFIGIMSDKYLEEALYANFDIKKSSDNISEKFVIVPESVYASYMKSYSHSYARIYVDEYPYVSDVTEELHKLGYDVMSPFMASSATLNEDKMLTRSITLIISLVSLALIFLIFYLYYRIVERRKYKEERLMMIQGASKNTINKLNNLDLLFSNVFAVTIAFFIFLIVKSNIPYLNEAYKYVRFKHVFVIYLLVLILSILIMVRNNRKFNNFNNKGVA